MTSVGTRHPLFITSCWAMLLLCPLRFQAQDIDGARAPLGVYAHVDIESAIHRYLQMHNPSVTPGACYSLPPAVEADVHTYLQGIYSALLQDNAVAGITLGAHWCLIQRHQPNGTSDGNNWSYLDDLFNTVVTGQTVRLIITPGVNSPAWLLDDVLTSCDGLFPVQGTGSADPNCDKVTFSKLPEPHNADTHKFPLPWSPKYISYWNGFLGDVYRKYQNNLALVSIAVAGPNGASTEMILPTTANGSGLKVTDSSGNSKFYKADKMWSALIANALNGSAFNTFPNPGFYASYPEQVFVDSWNDTIDTYSEIFSGVTVSLVPDSGTNLPDIGSLPSTSQIQGVNSGINSILFAQDCTNNSTAQPCVAEPLPCQAKVEVLTHFVTAENPLSFLKTQKATEVGGMRAVSCSELGNIGVPGVKLLTEWPLPPLPPPPPPSFPFTGGAEFDYAVSQGNKTQEEGCAGNLPCSNPEEDAFNVLNVFFNCTKFGSPFEGRCQAGALKNALIQYVDLDYVDIQYAQSNLCPSMPPVVLGVGGKPSCTSLQDLLNWSQYYLFGMAGKQRPQPTATCPYQPQNNCQP